jgi:hypothetical protein
MKDKDHTFSEEQIRQWWRAIDEAARKAPTVTPASDKNGCAVSKSLQASDTKSERAKHAKR